MTSVRAESRAPLRVVTWNVWFGERDRELRQQALWAELAEVQPDVVCLQEVVPEHLDGPEIRGLRERGYWVSDRRIGEYDVLVLSRRPVLASERVPLPSVMGREMLVVRLGTDPPLTIATVHLESTKHMTAFRCRQLEDITAWLKHEQDVLLVGDMNFPDGEHPEAALLAGWTDAWTLLRPGEPGFTVDAELNEMRAEIMPGRKRARIDRVFYRGRRWRLDAIERLGMTRLSAEPPLFVSDHFGLRVDLSPR